MHQGSGHGKLILFGEHAAVYGHPAVGRPLPCRTELTLRPTDNSGSPSIHTNETGKDRDIFLRLLQDAGELGVSVPESGTWHKDGNVPRAGGFGSSAALCTALARVLLQIPDGYNREVHILANNLEKRFHGTPSGIDTGMSADSSPAAWVRSASGLPERQPLSIPPWPMLYGALERNAGTAALVGGIRERYNRNHPLTCQSLEALGRSAADFITLCTRPPGKHSQFAREAAGEVRKSQQALRGLNLSTPQFELILARALNLGALAGKFSGAGAGGAFYLCFPDTETLNHALSRLPQVLRRHNINLTVPLQTLPGIRQSTQSV